MTQPAAPRSRRPQPLRLRRRELLLLALLGCLGLFALLRSLAMQPYIDAVWRVEDGTAKTLASSPLPQLKALAGAQKKAVDAQGRALAIPPVARAFARVVREVAADIQVRAVGNDIPGLPEA